MWSGKQLSGQFGSQFHSYDPHCVPAHIGSCVPAQVASRLPVERLSGVCTDRPRALRRQGAVKDAGAFCSITKLFCFSTSSIVWKYKNSNYDEKKFAFGFFLRFKTGELENPKLNGAEMWCLKVSKFKLYTGQTTYFTPWCRVLLEKLTDLQPVKKFPAFHGTRRFITALTSVRHLSLSWVSPIQSIYPHSTSWRSILILSTHLRIGLPSGLFPSGFPTKTL